MSNTSPLHLAAFRGHNSAVATLAAIQSDVNFFDRHGRTPLDWAASQGHVSCIDTLIKYGAKIDLVQPESHLTSIHLAAAYGHAMCLQQLLHT